MAHECVESAETGTTLVPSHSCQPVALGDLNVQLAMKKKICQVCHYENRKKKWKSVMMCSRHGVRLCVDVRKKRSDVEPKLKRTDGKDVTDWSWTCNENKSCWDKFHQYYQPQGLFNNHFYVNGAANKCKFSGYQYTSKLYQKKYAALGIKMKRKDSKKRINDGKPENVNEDDVDEHSEEADEITEV